MSTNSNISHREVFGSRLVQARKMRGLSLRELAGKLEGLVSANALNKYERAMMMPGDDIVMALATALGVGPDFFFRGFRIELEGIHFRKRQSLGKKEELQVTEKARDYFERYLEAEEVLGIREPFESPIKGHVRTVDEAEERAAELRVKWNLGNDALPNIVDLMEENNVKVFSADQAPRSFDGFSCMAAGNAVVVVGGWLDACIPRKRMTLAHELAHAVFDTKGLDEKDEEKIAKRFAGAFLLPKAALVRLLGEKRSKIALQELLSIKTAYGISAWAVAHRAHELGIINDMHYRHFCMFANAQRWKDEGEPGDKDFSGKEASDRLRTLVFRALSEGVVTMSKAAALLALSVDSLRGQFSVVT